MDSSILDVKLQLKKHIPDFIYLHNKIKNELVTVYEEIINDEGMDYEIKKEMGDLIIELVNDLEMRLYKISRIFPK